MKKLILIIIVVSFLVSCKKKYACHCATTIHFTNSNSTYYGTSDQFSEKMTEKQAKSSCDEEGKNIDATHRNYITNNGNYTQSTITTTTNCNIE